MILDDAFVRGWRTIRRYAVPGPMIARATERRLAGDWRGACAAADVAADLDLPGIAGRHGAHAAAAIEDDLRHLAPDLLRWHLPRRPATGHTALSPRRLTVLARYGGMTPLAAAVHGMGSVELIRALVAAGARTGATMESGEPIADWMRKARPDAYAALTPAG